MKAGLSQSTQLKQELKINPRLYQAMDLLYMPLLDLQQHLKQELLNNPFLEPEEPATPEEETVKEKAAEEEKEKEEQIDWEEILLDGFEAGNPLDLYSPVPSVCQTVFCSINLSATFDFDRHVRPRRIPAK